jgi:hypothetical protein
MTRGERGRIPLFHSPVSGINFSPFTLEFGIDLKESIQTGAMPRKCRLCPKTETLICLSVKGTIRGRQREFRATNNALELVPDKSGIYEDVSKNIPNQNTETWAINQPKPLVPN